MKAPEVETGVSIALADYRKRVISDLAYTLELDIPRQKEQAIQASEVLSFQLEENAIPLQLDFKENPDHIKSLTVNGENIPIQHTLEHIIIAPAYLKEGRNEVEIEFIAGDLSLNRNDDYLYTLLVPDRARTVFPCFDQPNLKATFLLTLTLPADWKALSNAPLQDTLLAEGQKVYRFQNSDTLSTYLFSLVAGRFDRVSREQGNRTMHFLHRETDPEKIHESLEPVFTIHQDAIAFMEEYTQLPYPFQKFDFVGIPDFQYGGMEHVGAIDYKASTLFLDKGATQREKISRSSLISHETAHMWFGDLVTMRWFDDVWMKEVFANFMADKITQVALPDADYDLKFLIDHFPAAYGVDRTEGANAIRQPLDNLQEAGTLYGGIIYHKAPIMMRQLERLMGPEAFRDGLREYLKDYAYGNASWPDLIEILDAGTPVDLHSWNEVWVNETGRPLFTYELETKGNRITRLHMAQKGEDGSARLWPQLFEIALVYPGRLEELTVNMSSMEVAVEEAEGKPTPSFILFNVSGQGYGLFPVDERMLSQLYKTQNPVARAAAYINLYENMLNGRFVTPAHLLNIYRKGLTEETEELNLQLLTGQLSAIFWQFTPAEKRNEWAKALEEDLWRAMRQNTEQNAKKVLFKAYQNIAISQEAQDRLYAVWKNEQPPAGVILSEDDYTALATALAIRDYPHADKILAAQRTRIENPDRKKRLQFLMPALSSDVRERDAFFSSLKDAKNREKEAWVATALGYLHHPLRAGTSEKYLVESLNLLEEIQQTGDIFFPQNWLEASLGTYQSPQVVQVVRTFLQEHPDYNPRLRAKILQSADGVFRATQLLYASEGNKERIRAK